MEKILSRTTAARGLLAVLLFIALSGTAFAQGLNWEGQTGAFVTPFAYTSASPAKAFGRPQLAVHYLNGGAVVGHDVQASITVGLLKRIEFGYTRALVAGGDTPALSPLFENGFNAFHGKVNFLPENAFHKNFVPAVAAGFVARTQVRRVGGVLNRRDTSNGDFYLVATKTVTQVKRIPLVFSAGAKETNAALLGIAGNAPAWTLRAFGAAAFVVPGPAKSKLIFGSEAAQLPHYIKDLPGATLPTTLTYFARVIPVPERPLNFDFGVAQAANRVLPSAKVQARAQFALGISYHL